MKLIFPFLIFLSIVCTNNKAQDNDLLSSLNLRAYGIEIFVTDLRQAEEFYVGKLGFKIKSREFDSHILELKDESYRLWLVKTDNVNRVEYPNEAQTSLALQVNDLKLTRAKYVSLGVEFASEIDTVGIGLASRMIDPFGNAISILEQTVGNVEKFDEPRIYNFGYYFSDVPAARKLFIETLKFPVRTEKYFPPALPLANWDGSFGFMLHERKGILPSDATFPEETQVVVVFATDDIETAYKYFVNNGIDIFQSEPVDTPHGKSFAFKTKENIVSKICQPPTKLF